MRSSWLLRWVVFLKVDGLNGTDKVGNSRVMPGVRRGGCASWRSLDTASTQKLQLAPRLPLECSFHRRQCRVGCNLPQCHPPHLFPGCMTRLFAHFQSLLTDAARCRWIQVRGGLQRPFLRHARRILLRDLRRVSRSRGSVCGSCSRIWVLVDMLGRECNLSELKIWRKLVAGCLGNSTNYVELIDLIITFKSNGFKEHLRHEHWRLHYYTTRRLITTNAVNLLRHN